VIARFCDWLAATPLSTAFQTWVWFVPLVQIVHIISISVLFMAVLRVAIWLMRPTLQGREFSAFLSGLMPAFWISLSILLISGALLTITEPARELLNWAFRTKMILVLLLAAIIAVVRQLALGGRTFGGPDSSPLVARTAGLVSIALSIAIITAGRWIAYV
jgi:hypothetical protein